MIDYEGLILQRQELIEIWEDDPDSPFLRGYDVDNWWDEIPPEEFKVVTRDKK